MENTQSILAFPILVTGAAGFIGANLVKKLFEMNDNVVVVGLDNMNDYYDVSLKEFRLREIEKIVGEKFESKWHFVNGSIADKKLVDALFEQYHFGVVVNLAAQAGVRYSIDHPDVYIVASLM